MNCTNTEGPFRLIQSVPSSKAEPFKLWLAKTGIARKELERRTIQKVSTPKNYITEPEKKKKLSNQRN